MQGRKDVEKPRRKEVGKSKTTNLADALVFITREKERASKGGGGRREIRKGERRKDVEERRRKGRRRGRRRLKGQEVSWRAVFHKEVFEKALLFLENETSSVWQGKGRHYFFPAAAFLIIVFLHLFIFSRLVCVEILKFSASGFYLFIYLSVYFFHCSLGCVV